MQELLGRLSTLDPIASQSLKVIAYFDALVEARAGRLALLRGAARLTGCAAGYRVAGEVTALRVSPEGGRLPSGPPDGWPGRRLTGGGRIWIERETSDHPVDMMVLERFALATTILSASAAVAGQQTLETLVDAYATDEERVDAAERLRLAPDEPVRAVALQQRPGATTVGLGLIATRWGEVGLALLRRTDSWSSGPAGVGFAGRPRDLPASWSSALVALRARRTSHEVVSADTLGAVVTLAEALDAGAPLPRDVTQVERLQRDPDAARTLDAVADSSSLRAAAGLLQVHHSTLQARFELLARQLGFDPLTPHGRTRLDLSLALARVRAAQLV